MSGTVDLGEALAVLRGVRPRCATASDGELLLDLDCIESMGRLVDGWRITAAAEAERRSAKAFGNDALSFRNNASDGVNLVASVCRIPVVEAKRRVGLGAAIAARTSLGGDLLDSRYPALTAAVAEGSVGLGSARVIVEAVQHIRRRVTDGTLLTAMVEGLTEIARTMSTAGVEAAAIAWQLRLDPDGPPPDASGRDRGRAFRLGRTRADGLATFSGMAEAEDAAAIREALNSRRRGRPTARTEPGGDETCEQTDPEWREADVPDPRPTTVQDYDTVMEVLRAGLQAEQDGHASTATTHEVVVAVPIAHLEARRGRGWMPGVMAGIPMPTVERMTCSGGMRVLVTGIDGEPLYLSRTNRVFSPAQKKALIAASGGVCGVPGCTASVTYLEAHHIDWWHRDDGPTDIDNAILLCGYHHTLVHAKRSPIALIRHDGDVYVVPVEFARITPRPSQRRQRRPTSGAPPGRAAA